VTAADRRAVIFVGGTPYSGADVVADLLGGHPDVAMVPAALRFHTDLRGIPALLGGRIGLDDFLAELSGGGIAERVGREALDTEIEAFRASYDADPIDSSRALFWSLVDAADGDSARTLVDASPGNLLEAHTIARLIPESRFVHVVRDGRDVAGAVVEDGFAERMSAGLEWWADRLRDVERGLRGEEDGAAYAIPEGRVAIAALEGFARGAFAALLDEVGLDAHPVPEADAARLERTATDIRHWRRHARGPAAWWLSRRYTATLRELVEEGNQAAELLLDLREKLG
jgi:sulfotransferase family protein